MTTAEGTDGSGSSIADATEPSQHGREMVNLWTGQVGRDWCRTMLAANPIIAMCLEGQRTLGNTMAAMIMATVSTTPKCPEAAE